jgi:hypothetical protein
MYNRQILADHFNGKRAADDPEVQRDFRLLKEQAQIDWNAMYAGKDTRIDTRTTVESIEEDYIYNAQLVGPRVPITICLMPSSRAAWAIASAVCPVLTMFLKAIPAASAFPIASLRALADACEAASCQSLPIVAPVRSMALMFCTLSSTSEYLDLDPSFRSQSRAREATPENRRPGPKPLTEPMHFPSFFGKKYKFKLAGDGGGGY